MLVFIKGAGDLATGIAVRLLGAGYTCIMSDIRIPTAVRRTVSFSRAVYENEVSVNGYTGILAENAEAARRILKEGKTPIVIADETDVIGEFAPEVVVDAIVAKRNTGTAITDAKLVIGVGPGFDAGDDCHAVIETKRGHYLGQAIYKGKAIPNTGVPGVICGYSTERIIRAEADGLFEPVAQIGDRVKKGDIVAMSGGVEVCALMDGVVRGMLQPGVIVRKGLKCGDIDARSEREYCFSVSDKARAIGGGVLEVICRYEHGLI